MESNKMKIVIDGIDGTGKTSICEKMNEKHSNITTLDRGILTKLTLLHWDLWEKELNRDFDYYIILEADINESRRRLISRADGDESKLDKWETEENLFLFRARFRQLAAFYGNIHVIDTTNKTIDQVFEDVEQIVIGHSDKFIVPSIEKFTEEEFAKLTKIAEGESKIVREFNWRFHIVKYKPTVYSHKKQRAGEVEGTDQERMLMTKNILDILIRHKIKHCYWQLGSEFILTENLNNDKDIPPLEVIVKKCFVGSDKHRYYKLEDLKNRWGKPVVIPGRSEYQKLLVRFDYRNPNHHPETGIPLGDILVCEDLADEFINVEVARKTALHIFKILDYHFAKFNIYFQDVCLMLTVDGDKLYGEISQDCGRYKYINENELTDLDKDIWRAGGSSELVCEKYRKMTKLTVDYVKDILYEQDKIDFA